MAFCCKSSRVRLVRPVKGPTSLISLRERRRSVRLVRPARALTPAMPLMSNRNCCKLVKPASGVRSLMPLLVACSDSRVVSGATGDRSLMRHALTNRLRRPGKPAKGVRSDRFGFSVRSSVISVLRPDTGARSVMSLERRKRRWRSFANSRPVRSVMFSSLAVRSVKPCPTRSASRISGPRVSPRAVRADRTAASRLASSKVTGTLQEPTFTVRVTWVAALPSPSDTL